MGAFAPVFLAFILNCLGITIFREFKPPTNAPLLSFIIFHFSVFFLLWDIKLYPRSLRKIWRCGEHFITFLFASFLIEHIMSDFWAPISTGITALPTVVAESVDEYNESPGVGTFIGIMKNDSVGILLNHLFSLFALIAVLHATRIIDLRDMEFGFVNFLKKSGKHFVRSARKLMGHSEIDLSPCGTDFSEVEYDIIRRSVPIPSKSDSKYFFEDVADTSCDESLPNLSDATEDYSEFEYEPPLRK